MHALVRRLWVVVLAAVCVVICDALQSSASIAIEPTVVQLVVKPGHARRGQFKVTNNGDEQTTVSIEPEDWVRRWGSESGTALDAWLRLKPKKFRLGPGATRSVYYKVKLPRDARGELIAMVFFSPRTEGNRAQTLRVKTRIGACLCVIARGTIEYDAKIDRIELLKQKDTLQALVVVRNLSNIHIRPEGKVYVFSSTGDSICEFAIQPRAVYPGSTRGLVGYQQDFSFEPGRYRADVHLRITLPDERVETISASQWFEVTIEGLQLLTESDDR